jgi:putative FmdB family regulatory protein
MPTYEYECTLCGHVVDVFHSMTAKPRVKCPECGGRTKKKIGAGAGIIFKGSGFYETDYKRKSSKSNSASSKPSEPKKDEKKADTTPKAEKKD